MKKKTVRDQLAEIAGERGWSFDVMGQALAKDYVFRKKFGEYSLRIIYNRQGYGSLQVSLYHNTDLLCSANGRGWVTTYSNITLNDAAVTVADFLSNTNLYEVVRRWVETETENEASARRRLEWCQQSVAEANRHLDAVAIMLAEQTPPQKEG